MQFFYDSISHLLLLVISYLLNNIRNVPTTVRTHLISLPLHLHSSLQTLSVLIERSADLRMLDLRDNCISLEGVKVLVAAVSRNAR